MKRIATLLVVMALVLIVGASPATASRSDEWRARALTAVSAFQTMDQGQEGAFAYAQMAHATALLHGWNHPQVAEYLDKVFALRNPDGGWGLKDPFDFFGDGTINPATTTYTITLAHHVGPVLFEGWKAGVVPASEVQNVISLLMTTQRHTSSTGRCLAYSRSPYDVVTTANGRCIHNVNAAAGWFLQQVNAAGFIYGGMNKLIVDITRREVSVYNPTTMFWNYWDAAAGFADTDHNSAEAEFMYILAYPVGRESVWNHMNNALADRPSSPIAHMRLTGLSGGLGPMHSSGATWWCVLGDNWLDEFDDFIAEPLDAPGIRLAQASYYASRNAEVC